MNENSPDDLAALEAELAEAEHRVVHRVDPGPTALPVAVAVLVVLVSLVLPWTGGVPGWQILAGVENFGLLPRLFTVTAIGVRRARLGGGAGHAVLGGGLDVRGGVRVLRRERGVGDLVAAGQRPARRHRPGDRPGAGGDRDDRPDGVLGAHRGPPRLTQRAGSEPASIDARCGAAVARHARSRGASAVRISRAAPGLARGS